MKRYLPVVLLIALGLGEARAETSNVYLRMDGDHRGQIMWVGGSNGAWAHDFIWYMGTYWIEADLGYLINVAPGNDIQPMMGLNFDPVFGKLNWYVPQLFWFSSGGRHSSEFWFLSFISADQRLNTSHWLLFMERYDIGSGFRLGPQFEWYHDYHVNNETAVMAGLGVKFDYGPTAYVDLSVSHDFENERAAARLTFVKYFE